MRTVRIGLGLAMTWLAATSVSAAVGSKISERNFYLEVAGEYSTQWYRIYLKGRVWVCQTDAVPYFEAMKNPLESLDWKSVGKPSADLAACRDKVLIQDYLREPARKTRGCLSETRFKKVVEGVHEACSP